MESSDAHTKTLLHSLAVGLGDLAVRRGVLRVATATVVIGGTIGIAVVVTPVRVGVMIRVRAISVVAGTVVVTLRVRPATGVGVVVAGATVPLCHSAQ